MKKRFQQLITQLLKRGNISAEDRAELTQEEQAIIDTAKLLVASRHEDKPYRMEFKEELKQKVLALHGAKQEKREKTKKHVWRALHIKTLAGTGIGVMAVAAVVAFSVFQQSGLINVIRPGQTGGILIPIAHAHDNFTLEPEVVDDFGVIAQNTDFILTSEARIAKGDIESHLQLSNGGEFSVDTIRRGYEYRINPNEDLTEGEILQVSVATLIDKEEVEPFKYQWVFEVADHFKIQSSNPDHKSTGVPTNNAVEFVLSHAKTIDLSAYLTISPAHSVRIEQDFRTVKLIPSEPWQDETLYTITIASDFGVDPQFIPLDADLSQWRLQEDYIIQFTTGDIAPPVNGSMSFSTTSLQSRPGEVMELSGYVYQLPETTTMDISIHKVDQTAINQVIEETTRLQQWIPTRLRTRLSEEVLTTFGFTNPIVNYEVAPQTEYGRSSYTLNALQNDGVYLVEARIGAQTELFFWSVSEIGAYIVLSETTGFIWTVDTELNTPKSDVSVYSRNQLIGASNAEGIVSVTKEQIMQLQEQEVFTLIAGENTTIHPVFIWGDTTNPQPEYQGFMQLDQYLVHSDDTVKYWGLIKRADAEVSTVRVEVSGWPTFGSYREVLVQEQVVSVDEQGFFRAEMPLANLRDGYYQLAIYDGDYLFRSKTFDVKAFATPELAITANPQYQRIDAGESNTITIFTTRFDGTPASFIDLEITGAITQQVRTDENGEAIVTATSQAEDCGFYGCNTGKYQSIIIRPIGPFETEVEGFANWVVTQKYLDFSLSTQEEENTINVEGHIRGVQYLTKDVSYPDSSQTVYNDAAGIPFKATVLQLTSERSELQSELDPRTNQTLFYYDFSIVETRVDLHEGLTNENGKISFSIPKQDQTNYKVILEGQDQFGRFDRMEESIGLYALPRGKVYVEGETADSFINEIEQSKFDRGLWVKYDWSADIEYKVGDEIEFEAFLGEGKLNALPETAHTVFYTVAPNIVDVFQQANSKKSITITEDYIPDFSVGAATIHDGVVYYTEFFLPVIDLSPEPYELSIDIQTDQERYGIRETVLGEVMVTDVQGNPVQALVNLNVLDKAYLELDAYAGQQNPLSDLYARQYTRILVNTGTHRFASEADGMGGGGGDGRINFLEQATYQFVQTDENGKGSFEFALPDNITTWVINAAAATTKLQGGIEQASIIVDQPFVVQAIQSDSYLVEDTITISARNYTNVLSATDEVQYSFYGPLRKEEGKAYSLQDFPIASQTVQAPSIDIVDFPVTTDGLGEYMYALRAKSGDFEDILIKEFTVLSGRGTTPVTKTIALESTWQAEVPEDAMGRVALRFASPLGADAYNALNTLCDCATQLDYALAKARTANLFAQYFGLASDYEEEVTSEYKHPDGGYTQFPFGSADIALTSSIATLQMDEDTTDLRYYFEQILREEPTPREAALAFRGLAAGQNPGYAQLLHFAQRDDFDVETRLLIADAFLLYGDLSRATTFLNRALVDSTEQNGQRSFGELDINAESQQRRLAELARTIAFSVGNDAWSEFDVYLSGKEVVDPISFVRFWGLRLERQPITDMSFVIAIGEESQFVTLQGFESFGLDVTKEELAQLSLQDIRGNVEVLYAYEVQGQQPSEIEGVRISRTYSQGDGPVTTIDSRKEVLVRIEIEPRLASAYGFYELHDVLPSGLQAITRGQQWGFDYDRCTYNPYRTSLHYAKALVSLNEDCAVYTIEYTARAVASTGRYKAEGVQLTNLDTPSIRAIGETIFLEIES